MTLSPDLVLADRYRIVEKVGSGGMADVYRAFDEKEKRDVAIKILRKESAEDVDFLRRFRAEALAVKQLSHDGIVQMFDLGEYEGIPYIVLEFIEGQTLKQMIRDKGALPPELANDYMVQICDALQHAHQKNLVHRDIKPQNIMITPDNKVKIMDFGIARFVDASTITYAGGNVLGSVHYVSPEQARGQVVGASSDIYSLGIVLYEMLTGEVPFDNENSVTIVLRQIQESLPAPSSKMTGIGKAYDGIVSKATQKDPQYRYRSLLEMRRDLLRAKKDPDGDFVKIRTPVPDNSKLGRFFRTRSRKGTIMAVIISAILVLGIAASVGLMIYGSVQQKRTEGNYVIPQLIGKTEEDALARAQDANMQMTVRSYVSSESYPPGQVCKQDPVSGSYGKEGDVIRVDISTGPNQLELPDLSGDTLTNGEATLADMGLHAEIEWELSDSPEGTILHQSPNGGSMAEPGDFVTLWVSGETDPIVAMPDLSNLRLNDALLQIRNAGISKLTVYYLDDEKNASNLILSQTPLAGEDVSSTSSASVEVVRPRNMAFFSRVETTVDVEESGSLQISSARDDAGLNVQTIWFEEEVTAGEQSIVLDIESETDATQTVEIRLDGNLLKEIEATMAAGSPSSSAETTADTQENS